MRVERFVSARRTWEGVLEVREDGTSERVLASGVRKPAGIYPRDLITHYIQRGYWKRVPDPDRYPGEGL